MTSKTAVADPVAIADAHLVIGEPVHGEVLAELSVDEVVSAELAFPVPIRVDLVNEHRALFPAVPGEIALTITLDVELSHAAWADHGILEDAGENRLPFQSTFFGMPTLTDNSRPATSRDSVSGVKRSCRPARPESCSFGQPPGSHLAVAGSIATSSATISAAGCVRLASATLCPAHIDSGSISPVVPTIGGAGS